jgi:acetyltransferase-like isoleucine patch superfamily enzyme
MLSNVAQRIVSRLAYVAPGGRRVRPWLHRRRGVRMGRDVWISQGVYIDELHPEAVAIGDNCTIGLRTSIFTHFYWGSRRSGDAAGPVVIEDDVFIGPHCVVLPNVRIGRGAVIKAGTVVTRSVPAGALWGVPSAEWLGRATVPLTAAHTYEDFVRGLRPVRRRSSPGNDRGRAEHVRPPVQHRV